MAPTSCPGWPRSARGAWCYWRPPPWPLGSPRAPARARQQAAPCLAACYPANATESDTLLDFRARLQNGAEALPGWVAGNASAGWSGVGCAPGGQVRLWTFL